MRKPAQERDDDAAPVSPRPRVMAPAAVLLALAREGDEAAFEALVRQEQDRAFLIALRLSGNPQDAQDCVQEAFLQAWKSLPAFRGEARFSTWFTRILINKCHNLRRTAPVAVEPLDEEGIAGAPNPDQLVEEEHRRGAVRRAVLALPFEQRTPLVLYTFAGYSHAEVGRILGISEGAAKVRVHRARRALVEALREWR